MYIIILIGFLCYILIFPREAVDAAALGLNLWYEKMLPTLLPFSILSYILIQSGILDGFARFLHRFLKHIFPVSSAGIYPLIAGLLFGFPMGSKITAELVAAGKMTKEEGQRLFCVCNNISPMFIGSFILTDCLQRPDLRIPSYLILYVPSLVLYMLQNRRRSFPEPEKAYDKTLKKVSHNIKKNALCAFTADRRTVTSSPHTAHPAQKIFSSAGNPKEFSMEEKKTTSMSFQIIDAGIMNGFETLAKLGGYIMIFAIFAEMTMLLPISHPTLKCLLVGFTEITNGIAYTAGQNMAFQKSYPLLMAYTAFGGLSGFAQTASMIKETGFSMKPYFLTKLFGTAAAFLLALLFVH